MYKIFEVLKLAEQKLQKAGVESSKIDSRILLQKALSISKEQLILNYDNIITIEEYHQFEKFLDRRISREPIAKILGEKEFWSMNFKVNEHILDPRADTEILVESVINYYKDKPKPKNILDLGTGSGCILLSILSEFTSSKGIGVDKNYMTALIAKENSQRLNLSDRAKFVNANWNDPIAKKFDLIVSNPPYIKSNDIGDLEPEVAKYDPIKALDGGDNGLDCYQYLADNLANSSNESAVIFLEIGEGQEREVTDIFSSNGFKFLKSDKDLSGIIRCLTLVMV